MRLKNKPNAAVAVGGGGADMVICTSRLTRNFQLWLGDFRIPVQMDSSIAQKVRSNETHIMEIDYTMQVQKMCLIIYPSFCI